TASWTPGTSSMPTIFSASLGRIRYGLASTLLPWVAPTVHSPASYDSVTVKAAGDLGRLPRAARLPAERAAPAAAGVGAAAEPAGVAGPAGRSAAAGVGAGVGRSGCSGCSGLVGAGT